MPSETVHSWVTLEHALLLVYLSCVARGAAARIKLCLFSVFQGYKALRAQLSARGIGSVCPKLMYSERYHDYVTMFCLFKRKKEAQEDVANSPGHILVTEAGGSSVAPWTSGSLCAPQS